MEILDKLQAGSFRGVTFFINNSSTEGGRKTVTHEYPNTDRRVVEDLGLNNDIFTIGCVVPTQVDFDERDKLKEALDAPGPGLLIHPFYGRVDVVSKSYTLSESPNNLGIATFSLVFEKAQPAIYPEAAKITSSWISALSGDATDATGLGVADTFEISSPSNYQAALAKMQDIGAAFGTIGKTVSSVTGEINQFSANVTTFTNGITTNLLSPVLVVASIKTLFTSLETIVPDALTKFELAKHLLDFGSDDIDIPKTTVERTERANNQTSLNEYIRGASLIFAYNNAANIDYTNEIEIQEVNTTLEDAYQALVDSSSLNDSLVYGPSAPSVTINNEITSPMDSLTGLRGASNQFFDDLSLTVDKIYTIHTVHMPMTILAYQYYGSTEKTEALVQLNDTNDVSYIDHSVKILTP